MITRDNYEEFFLLYTDNELSAAERHEVERFVADHPELREEWEAFLQCRVAPDPHLAFPDRAALLKPEAEGSIFTEDLLSYIDGELNKEETARIEAIIHEQPRVAHEFGILRQTVDHPDPAVVFPEKDRLYRTERERKIVFLPWVRAGIAAAIAGAIALILLLPAKRQPDQPVQVVIARHDSPGTTHKIIPTVTPATVTALNPGGRQPTAKQNRTEKQFFQKREPRQLNDVAAGNGQDITPTVIRKQPGSVKASRDSDPVTTVTIGSAPATGDLAAIVHPAVQTGIPKDQSSFASEALQEEQATDQHSPVADDAAAAGRTKLRGIFRKVARTFGKTAERDSDGNRQVLVGAFQVSLD
ncbi:MAG TPA: hypothetical protein VFE32_06915 [Puia sp.]|jgi:anti-sigma factor RsiW|nr:hypothetical protein [Puia sp.]